MTKLLQIQREALRDNAGAPASTKCLLREDRRSLLSSLLILSPSSRLTEHPYHPARYSSPSPESELRLVQATVSARTVLLALGRAAQGQIRDRPSLVPWSAAVAVAVTVARCCCG